MAPFLVEYGIVCSGLEYLCMDLPVCGLLMHDHKLLITNDEGGEIVWFSIGTKFSIQIKIMVSFHKQ
jgi:hypothetical protein